MEWLTSFLPWWMNWFTGLAGGGTIAGLGAAWFFGLMPAVMAVVSPLLGALVQGFIWLWQNVFWPGIWDILDDWVTIVTVATGAAVLYFMITANAHVQVARMEREVNICRVELQKVNKSVPESETTWSLPWPWNWK